MKKLAIMLPTLVLVFSACGQAPAFDEKRAASQTADSVATGTDSATDQTPNSDGTKTGDVTDANNQDPNTNKDSDGPNHPQDPNKDPNVKDDPANTANNSGDNQQSETTNPTTLNPKDGPIVHALKVGVNFEDLNAAQNSDFDFNDVVLCFTGDFSVQNGYVVSNNAQTVVAQVFSASDCSHRIDVHIINPFDGTYTTQSFPSHTTNAVSLAFKPGFFMEVAETPTAGPCTDARGMHDATYAKVLPNVCNLSGH